LTSLNLSCHNWDGILRHLPHPLPLRHSLPLHHPLPLPSPLPNPMVSVHSSPLFPHTQRQTKLALHSSQFTCLLVPISSSSHADFLEPPRPASEFPPPPPPTVLSLPFLVPSPRHLLARPLYPSAHVFSYVLSFFSRSLLPSFSLPSPL
jgi:hypothetical protein